MKAIWRLRSVSSGSETVSKSAFARARASLFFLLWLISVAVGIGCAQPTTTEPSQSVRDALTLDAANPPVLPTTGKRELLLSGRGFGPGMRVEIGGRPADVRWGDETSLKVELPPNLGMIGPTMVTVIHPSGATRQRNDIFRYRASEVDFDRTPIIPIGDFAASELHSCDLDGDGIQDILLWGRGKLMLFRGQSDGQLARQEIFSIEGYQTDWTDSRLAVIAQSPGQCEMIVYNSNAEITGTTYRMSIRRYQLVGDKAIPSSSELIYRSPDDFLFPKLDVRDYNNDGYLDYSIYYTASKKYKDQRHQVIVNFFDNDRKAYVPNSYELDERPSLIGDFDQDGFPDILANNSDEESMTIYWSNLVIGPLQSNPWKGYSNCIDQNGSITYSNPSFRKFSNYDQFDSLLIQKSVSDIGTSFEYFDTASLIRRNCRVRWPLSSPNSRIEYGYFPVDMDGDGTIEILSEDGQIRKLQFQTPGRGGKPIGLMPYRGYRLGRFADFTQNRAVSINGHHAFVGLSTEVDQRSLNGLLFMRLDMDSLGMVPMGLVGTQSVKKIQNVPSETLGYPAVAWYGYNGFGLITSDRTSHEIKDDCRLELGEVVAMTIEQYPQSDAPLVAVVIGGLGSSSFTLVQMRINNVGCLSLVSSISIPESPGSMVYANDSQDGGTLLYLFSSRTLYLVDPAGQIRRTGPLNTLGEAVFLNEIYSEDINGDRTTELFISSNTDLFMKIPGADPFTKSNWNSVYRGSINRIINDDFNLDKIQDLAISGVDAGSASVTVLSVKDAPAHRSLLPIVRQPTGNDLIGSMDLDGDGLSELLLKRGTWSFILPVTIGGQLPWTDSPSIARGDMAISVDLDQDGRKDLVTLELIKKSGQFLGRVFLNKNRSN